jgi:hypothetical protein
MTIKRILQLLTLLFVKVQFSLESSCISSFIKVIKHIFCFYRVYKFCLWQSSCAAEVWSNREAEKGGRSASTSKGLLELQYFSFLRPEFHYCLPKEKNHTSLKSLSTCRKITILQPCSPPMQFSPAQDSIRRSMGRPILLSISVEALDQ